MNMKPIRLVSVLFHLVFVQTGTGFVSSKHEFFASSSNGTQATKSAQAGRELPYYFQPERLIHKEFQQKSFQVERDTTETNKNSSPNGKRPRHIRLVAVVSPPFMMKRVLSQADTETTSSEGWPQAETNTMSNQNNEAEPVVEWYGYCMDFFRELVKFLPYELSYEIYEAPDGKFGSKTREIIIDPKNNKSQPIRREHWNGMIGELARGRAHLALGPMSVMAERELVVDYTVPFYDLVGIQILLKRPEVPRDWFKFLTVLDNEVWLSITLAYFVTSLIIYLFDRLSPYSHKNVRRVERIRARRNERLARRAATVGAGNGSQAPATAPSGHRPPSRPLSKPHESLMRDQNTRPLGSDLSRFGAKPAGVVYPFTHGASVQSISGQVDMMQQPSMLGDQKSSEMFPEGNKRRRLSQDYLHSLRLGGLNFANSNTRDHHSWNDDLQDQAGTTNPSSNQHRSSLDSDDSDELDSDSDQDGMPDFNLRDSLWFCITSLTPQGGGEAPQNLSGRVVAGAWWLFCFIVIASYTANLAAFLTVSRLDIPIESLDDLAKQYRIKYAPIEGTAEQSFFERMAYIEEIFYNIWKEMSLNDSLSEDERSKFAVWDYPISDKYTKIWAQIQEVQMPTSLDQAIERVKASTLADGFALLANANMIRYATMTDCSFRAVGEEFSRKPIALALAKNQEKLRDDLSYAILQLINKRYMEVLREKWWTNNPGRVVCDLNDESEGISIENIGGVFIIILAGVLLSFLVWAGERLLYRTKLDVSRNLLELSSGKDLSSSSSTSFGRRVKA